ncbi:chitin deacetylase, partial [Gonapodya sp. JEL0774]
NNYGGGGGDYPMSQSSLGSVNYDTSSNFSAAPAAPSVRNQLDSGRRGDRMAPWGSDADSPSRPRYESSGPPLGRTPPKKKSRTTAISIAVAVVLIVVTGIVVGVVLGKRNAGSAATDSTGQAAALGAEDLLTTAATGGTTRGTTSGRSSSSTARTSAGSPTPSPTPSRASSSSQSAAPTTAPASSSGAPTTTVPAVTTTTAQQNVASTTTAQQVVGRPNAPWFSLETQCVAPGMVALTFDDGPTEFTQGLLDLLDQLGIKATFFINGLTTWGVDIKAPYGQSILRRMSNSGHCIGVHTWTHQDLTLASDDQIRSEIMQVEDVLASTIGKRPYFMRPPYGYYNDHVLQLIRELGYWAAVLWNFDTNDWRHEDDVGASVVVFQEAMAPGPGAGNILPLMHDRLARVAQITAQVVPMLRANGAWRFVTMDECLGRACFR